MGLLDWFRRRRKKKIDKDKKMLTRIGNLRTKIKEQIEAKRKRTKESV